MEVEEPRRLERLGAAALVGDVFSRANDASVSSRNCGGEALMIAVYYYSLIATIAGSSVI